MEEDRDRTFAAIVLELGLVSRAHVEQALAARAKGDARPVGRILLANGWLDEPGYLRALDAQRARSVLGGAGVAPPPPGNAGRSTPPPSPALPAGVSTEPIVPDGSFRGFPKRKGDEEPSTDRVDLEKKRQAARAEVVRGALVAEAAANAPFVRALLGQVFGRTRVEKLVGKGPMAFVFHGSVDGTRPVTVKVLRADMVENARARARFARECQALARVDHPNVARVLDHGDRAAQGKTPEVHWIAVERDEGETLAERLEREKKLDSAETTRIARDAASGLAAAHRASVVHRDVRPETIFLTKAGGVRLVDFGLARDEEATDSITLKGQILGAPEYAAPELAEGAATPAVDVYGLGVTMFRMLTGELPYTTRSVVRLFTLHASAPIPWPHLKATSVPKKLSGFVRTLLAKKPEERPSMDDVARTLSDPGLGDPTSATVRCAGCGDALEEEPQKGGLPICAACAALVAARQRCGSCLVLLPEGAGRTYSGRAYCAECSERVRVPCATCKRAVTLADLARGAARREGRAFLCPSCVRPAEER